MSWRKLPNEENHNLYYLLNFTKLIKLKRIFL